MQYTFRYADAFNSELAWDTSSVTIMWNTFAYAKAFNQPLAWDTSKVTILGVTFMYAEAFNSELVWDTSSVTIMQSLFAITQFNQHIDSWDVTKVTVGNNNPQPFQGMFQHTPFISDDCKRQLTYASFSQQSDAFDLAYGCQAYGCQDWSSAVCPS